MEGIGDLERPIDFDLITFSLRYRDKLLLLLQVWRAVSNDGNVSCSVTVELPSSLYLEQNHMAAQGRFCDPWVTLRDLERAVDFDPSIVRPSIHRHTTPF